MLWINRVWKRSVNKAGRDSRLINISFIFSKLTQVRKMNRTMVECITFLARLTICLILACIQIIGRLLYTCSVEWLWKVLYQLCTICYIMYSQVGKCCELDLFSPISVYLARLIFEMPQSRTTKFMESVILTLYNYASNHREEYLLLKLFKTALQEEIR